MECKHEWVYQQSYYTKKEGTYANSYSKNDIFYCKFCLEQKEISKHQDSRDRPEWFKVGS